tara:strand:- start:176 stop:433 length:258 start_codon:yes stop_codon:yes gene_type:complete
MAKKQTLDAKRLGLAGGILWSVSVVIFSLIANANGYALEFMNLVATIYPGYTLASIGGILIGAIWGFLDAFIGLYLLVWLYNRLA